MLLISFMFVFLTYMCQKWYRSKYRHLASPGLCLPIIGHAYKMGTKEFKKDSVHEIWRIYKQYHKNGMMYFKLFGINTVWIGDFNTVKYIFNHGDGNGTITSNLKPIFKASRKFDSDQVPGVIFSNRETHQQQRQFAMKILRDFCYHDMSWVRMWKNVFFCVCST